MGTNPKVIVLAGPNGAGKSTAAPQLLIDTSITEFVNADVIAAEISPQNPESAAVRAGRIMLNRLDELAGQRISFAFETTLSGRGFASLLEKLIGTGYELHLVYLWVESPDISIDRVSQRVVKGGHSVPVETIRRRYEGGLRNLFELYLPLAIRWQIMDNTVGQLLEVASGRYLESVIVYQPKQWETINALARSAR